MAVLAFQDSVELVLGAVAEHLGASVKENAAFNAVLDEIDKVATPALTHRSALIQLNKARVNFKHHGLAPRDEDALKFRRNLEGFFPTVTASHLNLDFSTLSLSSLIAHQRTRNWIETAEGLLAEGNYDECARSCAVAVHIFESNRRRSDIDSRRRVNMRAGALSDDYRVAASIKEVLEEVQSQISSVNYQLDLIGNGVAYGDFRRFEDLTPTVHMMVSGRIQTNEGRSSPRTYDDALFCVTFARNLVLKLQAQYRRAQRSTAPALVVTRPTQLIVYPPVHDQVSEVILEVPVGTRLVSHPRRMDDLSGFAAISFQGDCVFVDATSVEPLQSA